MKEYWNNIDRWEYKSVFYTIRQWQDGQDDGNFKGLASNLMTNDGLDGWNAYSVVPALEEDYLNTAEGISDGYRVFYKRLVPDAQVFMQAWCAPDEE